MPVSAEVVQELRGIVQGRDRSAFLFVAPDGRPLDPHRMQRLIQAALVESKLDVPPGSGWHLLRHSRISLWVDAGIPIPTIAEATGHDPAVLMRTYAHATARAHAAMRSASHELIELDPEDAF